MKISSEQEMLDFGTSFAENLSSNVIELIGDVGAGKTTFVRGLAKGLGVKEPVTSPSFTISKSYALPNGKTLTHYDFYRLSDPGLMLNDLEEKLKNNDIVVIEWSNSIKNTLPGNRIIIEIKHDNDNSRNIIISQNSGRVTGVEGIPRSSQEPQAPRGCRGRENARQDPSKKLSLYLDTSTPDTILRLDDKEYQWHSDRDLAEKLLGFIHDKLKENGKDWHDLTEITFMSGPGSFTGLRIGASIVNTLAHELNIPLYTHKGEKVKIILPDYGRGANISKPRK